MIVHKVYVASTHPLNRMRGTTPAPMVPELPTESDETRPSETTLRADGGYETVHEDASEAPLVPHSS
jgi:hypothetical protein